MLFPLQCRINTNLLLDCVKLIGYFASAANVISSNLLVSRSPKIKISLFLLSVCPYELASIPKRTRFFPKLPSVNENCEPEAILMPWPLCLYLSGSAFLVSFTDPKKNFLM